MGALVFVALWEEVVLDCFGELSSQLKVERRHVHLKVFLDGDTSH